MSADRAELKRIDNVDKGIADLTYLCLMPRNLQMDNCLSKFINTFNQSKYAAATVSNKMSLIKQSLFYKNIEKMSIDIPGNASFSKIFR